MRIQNRIPIQASRKVAMVCSGGGVKAGAFHLGVALALRERGFVFRGGLKSSPITKPAQTVATYVGSSAGALIAAYLASGYSLENIFFSFDPAHGERSAIDRVPRVLPRLDLKTVFALRNDLSKVPLRGLAQTRDFLRLAMRGDWGSLFEMRWFRSPGLFSTRGIERFLAERVLETENFRDLAVELFVVATELNQSAKIAFGPVHEVRSTHDLSCTFRSDIAISKACAASVSLPFIFSPTTIDLTDRGPTDLIDGEVRDTLSTHIALERGADLVFASYTHQPYNLSPEFGRLSERGLPAIMIQSIYLAIEQRVQSVVRGRMNAKQAYASIEQFFEKKGLSLKLASELIETVENDLGVRKDAEIVYIHPRPGDAQLFFQEHFAFDPRRMNEIVRAGFRAAADVLRRYEFQGVERANAPVTHLTSQTV